MKSINFMFDLRITLPLPTAQKLPLPVLLPRTPIPPLLPLPRIYVYIFFI